MEPPNDIDRLKDQEAELERQLEELRARRIALEKRVRTRSGDVGRPLRELVLDMLQEAGAPLNSLLLASVIRPLFGRAVPATRFGTLSDDEAKSYELITDAPGLSLPLPHSRPGAGGEALLGQVRLAVGRSHHWTDDRPLSLPSGRSLDHQSGAPRGRWGARRRRS